MPSQAELRALYPPEDAEFEGMVRATLEWLDEDAGARPVRRRRGRWAVALAAALVLALACTAVAAGLGVFGRLAQHSGDGMRALYDALEEKSDEGEAARILPADDGAPYPQVTFDVSQSYVDGEEIYLAYEVRGLESVVDYTWTPTAEELAGMHRMDAVPVPVAMPDGSDSAAGKMIAHMRELAARNGSASAIEYASYLGDGVYLAGTETCLDIVMDDERIEEDGTVFGMKRFALPQGAAREADELTLDFTLYRAEFTHHYDGEFWYTGYGGRTQTRMSVTVPRRAEGERTACHAERTLDTYRASVAVTWTDLLIQTEITLESLNGQPMLDDEGAQDSLIAYRLYIDGVEAAPVSSSDSGLGTPVCTLTDEYARPERMPQRMELVPLYRGDDGPRERWDEALLVELTAGDAAAR